MALGEDQAIERRCLGGGAIAAAHGFAAGLGLDFGKLVGDLALAAVERLRESGVEGRQIAAEAFDGAVYRLRRFSQNGMKRGRHQAGGDALAQNVFAREKVGQCEAVARQQLLAVVIEDGESGARNHYRHAAQNRPVEHLGLREVRRFRRTHDDADCRQNGVLHHRPQQRVR